MATDTAKMTSVLPNAATFEFRAGAVLTPTTLTVVEFRGVESVSRTYRFKVELLSELPYAALLPALLGARGSLALQVPGHATRFIQGVVTAVEALGKVVDGDRTLVSAVLEPRLALLQHTKRSRVFQNLSARAVIEEVLEEGGIQNRWSLSRALTSRAYCVQYQESDLAFIERLLAEEGIYYSFEQPFGVAETLTNNLSATAAGVVTTGVEHLGGAGTEQSTTTSVWDEESLQELVVFSDTDDYPELGTTRVASIDTGGLLSDAATIANLSATGTFSMMGGRVTPELTFREQSDALRQVDEHREFVTSWVRTRRMRPKSVRITDFDLNHPAVGSVASYGLTAGGGGVSFHTGISSAATLSLGIGGTAPAIGCPPADFGVHLHNELRDQLASKEWARRSLEQLRRDAVVARAKSSCRRISAGYRFALAGHSVDDANGEHVVVEVTHRGHIPEVSRLVWGDERAQKPVYQNRFTAAPASVRLRPELRDSRPGEILDTAFVVGSDGGPIDALGRLRVKFGWDRDSSGGGVWIPVGQALLGAGWGTQRLPLEGTEVVVAFALGALDRPYVIGCVRNPLTPSPFLLPAEASKSGFRFRTSDTGYNEICFDDAPGAEALSLHSDGSLTLEAAGSLRQTIGSATAGAVGDTADGDTDEARLEVTVWGNAEQVIHGQMRQFVQGDMHERVGDGSTETVAGTNTLSIGGDCTRDVLGSDTSTILGSVSQWTRGNRARRVGGNLETDALSVRATVGAASTHAISGHSALSGKTIRLAASEVLTVEATNGIRLRTGRSEIALLPDELVMQSACVSIEAMDAVALRVKKTSVVLDESGGRIQSDGTISAGAGAEMTLRSQGSLACLGAEAGEVTLAGSKVDIIGQSSHLNLGATAALQGSRVLLDAPKVEGVALEFTDDVPKTTWTDILLTDPWGLAMAGARYVVQTSHGIINGTTDPEGKARIPLADGDAPKLTLPAYDSSAYGPQGKSEAPPTQAQTPQQPAPGVSTHGPWKLTAHLDDAFFYLLDSLCKELGGSAENFLAMFIIESGLSPRATNKSTQCVGISQIMPEYLKLWGYPPAADVPWEVPPAPTDKDARKKHIQTYGNKSIRLSSESRAYVASAFGKETATFQMQYTRKYFADDIFSKKRREKYPDTCAKYMQHFGFFYATNLAGSAFPTVSEWDDIIYAEDGSTKITGVPSSFSRKAYRSNAGVGQPALTAEQKKSKTFPADGKITPRTLEAARDKVLAHRKPLFDEAKKRLAALGLG